MFTKIKNSLKSLPLMLSNRKSVFLSQVMWNTSHIGIFVNNNNPYYTNLLLRAVCDWNATGATDFFVTNDIDEASIVISLKILPGNIATTLLGNPDTGELYEKVRIYLNPNFVNGDANQSLAVLAVEHELGHALGLAHRYDVKSIMNDANINNQIISSADIEAVLEHNDWNYKK